MGLLFATKNFEWINKVITQMRTIKLTRGFEAIVDEDDYERLTTMAWQYNSGYAQRRQWINGKRVGVKMHRMAINAPPGVHVDHINGNKLDNRKSNLRLASRAENNRNATKRYNNRSGYKGVNYHPPSKKWQARITVNKKTKSLGLFLTAEDAALAYNNAALKFFGEFAKTN